MRTKDWLTKFVFLLYDNMPHIDGIVSYTNPMWIHRI